MISAIVAASDNDVIGDKGKIPWRLPADSAFVAKKTAGKPLIMGSATHDSIGKVLPGRANIVVSRDPEYKVAPGAILVRTVEEALVLPQVKQADEAFIFGGETIYRLAMPYTDRIYLTHVHTTVEGDRFFRYDPQEWQEISKQEHKKDAENPYDFDFIVLERK